MNKLVQIIFSILILSGCSQNSEKEVFPSFLSEKCMIINLEQDNSIEGNYLIVAEFRLQDSSIVLELPGQFYLNNNNYRNWVVGWGDEIPYHDAGVENIRAIRNINISKGEIFLGELMRGSNYPKEGAKIVFWNTKPSGFKRVKETPIIDTKKWPSFKGESVSFGSVVFDSIAEKWIMLFNECDTNKISVYAAQSENLIDWEPANEGLPLLTANDFINTKWCGYDARGSFGETPQVSDVIRYNGKWYVFMDGFNKQGQRQIGLTRFSKGLLNEFEVLKNPVLTCGRKGSWNEAEVFYAKVEKGEDGFYMFFDGADEENGEAVGMAKSKNLLEWNSETNNPVIHDNNGWRSSTMSAEPNYVEINGDTILIMIAGIKDFRSGLWNRFFDGGWFVGGSGNVYDAQLGMYRSIDRGKTFLQHANNPILVNDYSCKFENEHMGGNIERIETDSTDYLFYQAKSSQGGLKYNLMLRSRPKK